MKDRRPRRSRPGPAALAVASLLSLRPAPGLSQNGPHPSRVPLEPCGGLPVEGALCGTFAVFEDRAAARGREIALHFVLLPATGPEPRPEPFVFLAGGPGGVATDLAYGADSSPFKEIREARDLLLLDRRGVGGSHPLECDLYGDGSDPQLYLDDFMPLARVTACRIELEKIAALGLYTSPIAMADLDELRDALGYEQLLLYGSSYGTREALEYIRRYPERVVAAVLHGGVPPGFFMPLHYPSDTQRALDLVLAACLAEAACGRAFPEIRSELAAVAARLEEAPVTVEVRRPDREEEDELVPVRYSRTVLAEMVRYLLYNTANANRLPDLIHRAHEGDWRPLVEWSIRTRRSLAGGDGVFLSVTCAQDVPFVAPREAERLARGTLLGLYRYRNQREACDRWVRGELPPDFNEPVRSEVPVLLLNGELDPVTPPRTGEQLARGFPNHLRVVVPHAAHGFGGVAGIECVDRLTADFVSAPRAELDLSCLAGLRRGAFAR